jgi:hypothetical protein
MSASVLNKTLSDYTGSVAPGQDTFSKIDRQFFKNCQGIAEKDAVNFAKRCGELFQKMR